jgi:sigma-B regulation protein RsbU (phosphoserine phosphatase)
VSIELKQGDVFVFCTDGIFEALNEEGAEFGASRLADVVSRTRDESARAIVDAIFEETAAFRGTRPQGDDMTAVAVKITA